MQLSWELPAGVAHAILEVCQTQGSLHIIWGGGTLWFLLLSPIRHMHFVVSTTLPHWAYGEGALCGVHYYRLGIWGGGTCGVH